MVFKNERLKEPQTFHSLLESELFVHNYLYHPGRITSLDGTEMGIKHLTQLIQENAPSALTEHQIPNYFGRVIGIDASMALYQFLVGQFLNFCAHSCS